MVSDPTWYIVRVLIFWGLLCVNKSLIIKIVVNCSGHQLRQQLMVYGVQSGLWGVGRLPRGLALAVLAFWGQVGNIGQFAPNGRILGPIFHPYLRDSCSQRYLVGALLLVVRERLRSDAYGRDLSCVDGDWCDGMEGCVLWSF